MMEIMMPTCRGNGPCDMEQPQQRMANRVSVFLLSREEVFSFSRLPKV